jgi:hypothetical protein
MNPEELNPNDELIFSSPYSGQDSKVSYRGPYQGKAMIWTGTTQFTVEYQYLRRAL